MTTPNFTGTESVFDGINGWFPRGINPADTATYSERFALFLKAVNSSEDLKADISAIAFAQATGNQAVE